jgi:hypothetical protein
MGSSGGSQSTNKFTPPDYTVPGWQDYLTRAQGIGADQFAPYGGQTVAELSKPTLSGIQMATDFAQQGTPERSAGGATLLNAMQGGTNPYALQSNPYSGQNPFLQQMIENSNSLIGDTYRRTTEAGLNASMARAGAFGGSQYEDQKAANERNLTSQLAANTNNLLSNQYNQSANLAENQINRATGAYDTAQSRALQAAGLGQGQQQLDMAAINNMIQQGQIPQQYQQALLNAGQQFYQQGQQAPISALDFIGNALARASGNYGTNTMVGPGMSPLTAGLGAGAIGYGLLG